MAVETTHIKQIKAGTKYYELAARALLDSAGNEKTYEDITSLIEASFDIVVLETLPAANVTSWNTYHNNIVLVPDSGDVEHGSYLENIIVRSGSAGSYTYAWEVIGNTKVDLSDYAKLAHTHTVSVPTVTVDKTKKLGATASGTALNVTANTDFVKSYPGATSKLVTTSITPITIGTTGDVAIFQDEPDSISVITDIAGNTTSATGDIGYVASVTTPTLGGTKTFNTDAIKSASVDVKSATATGYKPFVESVALSGTTTFNTDAIKTATLDSQASSTTGYQQVMETATVSGTFNTNAIKSAALDIKTSETSGYNKYVESVTHTGASIATSSKPTLGASTDKYLTASAGQITPTGTQASITVTSDANGNVFNSASVDANGILSFGTASLSTNAIKSVNAFTPTITLTSSASTSTGAVKYVEAQGALTADTYAITINGGSITPTYKYAKVTTTAAGTGSPSITPTYKWLGVTTAAASTGTVGIDPTTKYIGVTTAAAGTGTVTISGGVPTTKYLHKTTDSVTKYDLTSTDIAVPQAGTAVTVATGSLSTSGTGATVMTGLGTATTAKAVTAVSVSTQPTITITEATTNNGPVNEHTTVGSNTVTTSGGTNPQA